MIGTMTALSTAPNTPDSGYPLGWESVAGVASRMGESSRATVTMTGSPTQSNPRSPAFSILGTSPRRGMHEGREYHERGATSILEVRWVSGQRGF